MPGTRCPGDGTAMLAADPVEGGRRLIVRRMVRHRCDRRGRVRDRGAGPGGSGLRPTGTGG
ncbi:hypothetical protein [Streptomyces sp. MUM 2J]|uniref:hypothetical protein n=1 Tax=Streptomyces sp. MUM 2J TaxID=2791987 RepID=UPI001F0382A6|nr:hypothetical protein [Streptomyces sp. MUM 2J]MCH0562350.1 hypothetical protein [Streptomyces sp. MUM 2J]